MDFFNKIGDMANKAGKKTEDLTKEAKIRMKINEVKGKMDELYKEMGKELYQKHIDGAEITKEDFISLLLHIDNLSNILGEYQEEIRKLKKMKVCPNCSAEIDQSIKFCPHCGTEQPEIKPEEVIESEIVEESDQENINADDIK